MFKLDEPRPAGNQLNTIAGSRSPPTDKTPLEQELDALNCSVVELENLYVVLEKRIAILLSSNPASSSSGAIPPLVNYGTSPVASAVYSSRCKIDKLSRAVGSILSSLEL